MKRLIIIAVLVFVINSTVTMLLTGTLKRIDSPTGEATETEQTASSESEQLTDAQQGEKKSQEETIQKEAKQAEYEAQIAEAEAKLAAIKSEIESLNARRTSITRTQQLAKLYGSMKPDTAASILIKLEEDLTKQILTEMSDRTAGKIMEAIAAENPSYAAKISELIAGTNKS